MQASRRATYLTPSSHHRITPLRRSRQRLDCSSTTGPACRPTRASPSHLEQRRVRVLFPLTFRKPAGLADDLTFAASAAYFATAQS